MNASLIMSNILSPPILFFFLGMSAVIFKSDLEIPQPLPKLFSLYLLLAIGFKGGAELVRSGISQEVVLTLFAAIMMATIVPIYTFFILRIRLDLYNSAAIAATYGSISAVTFITAGSFLSELGIEFSGYMVAALALMESPAIIVGLLLVRIYDIDKEDGDFSWSEVLKEAFLNSSVYLLVGSLLIGVLSGEKGWKLEAPFTQEIFYGVLTFFLLDMGLVAAGKIKDLGKAGWFLISFSILIPILNATIGILLARLIGMPQGNALLFSVLCASASYIAVPAAMRLTLPEANPSLYVTSALAITFPFNIIIGIPLYFYGINALWR
ncbi:sodium-dependent bicarbonate transport family permease [aff. Roholtiella sp. LEGE 12411]|uniref:sodium-dependent bicarbonate transport family permease n=1 Tax=aff. Roholtiella sp. LEGE 12411 TaxID=1828822 RepID=UPI00188056B7|nr:sodium-dependent bicarbonate transport family permease [aff. Roholtiella sp. LEGE 12411]MBE9033926.1 sodium-dependent bicarbonate transport family permease [aff. Roholtiella sp. LEGE 12411]